jgi:hypothetical protein
MEYGKPCPRGLKNCEAISKITASNNTTFICTGYHDEIKEGNNDIFRHCFKTETTDTMLDYDEYDENDVTVQDIVEIINASE